MLFRSPFASILQSIVARFQSRRSLGDLKQVDFIWVNRDYQCLDWFLLLLRDLERWVYVHFSNFQLLFISTLTLSSFRSIFEGRINVQLFITSAPTSDNYDTLSLSLALELLYKVRNDCILYPLFSMDGHNIYVQRSLRDAMTGLKTKCQSGRPNWEELLGQIHKSSPHKVKPEFFSPRFGRNPYF